MAGYTTIVIGGQQVGLRFSIDAIKIAMLKNAVKIVDGVLETPDTVSTARYLHSAYIVNCYVKEIHADLTFEQFYDWADEQSVNGGEELLRLTQVITEANYVKPKEKTKEEQEKEAGKKKENPKKLIGTKLKRSA
jgi:hypothetical protein